MSDHEQYEHPLYPCGPHHVPMTVPRAAELARHAVGMGCLEGTLLLHPSRAVPCVLCNEPSRTTLQPIRTVECNADLCAEEDRLRKPAAFRKGVRRDQFPPDFYSLQDIALCEDCAGCAIDWDAIAKTP
jgi:hypothetical protein